MAAYLLVHNLYLFNQKNPFIIATRYLQNSFRGKFCLNNYSLYIMHTVVLLDSTISMIRMQYQFWRTVLKVNNWNHRTIKVAFQNILLFLFVFLLFIKVIKPESITIPEIFKRLDLLIDWSLYWHTRLQDVVHSEKRIYLVFEYLDLDLKKHMDSCPELAKDPRLVKVS